MAGQETKAKFTDFLQGFITIAQAVSQGKNKVKFHGLNVRIDLDKTLNWCMVVLGETHQSKDIANRLGGKGMGKGMDAPSQSPWSKAGMDASASGTSVVGGTTGVLAAVQPSVHVAAAAQLTVFTVAAVLVTLATLVVHTVHVVHVVHAAPSVHVAPIVHVTPNTLVAPIVPDVHIVHVDTVGVASATMTRVPTAIATVSQHCTNLYCNVDN